MSTLPELTIEVMSDLHFETRQWPQFISSLDPEGIDVLVLAGDIMPFSRKTERMLNDFRRKYSEVVYIAGNHEYYGTSVRAKASIVAAAKNAGVHFLQAGEVVTIGGRRFLGDTMWFPSSPQALLLTRYWSDFRCIKGLDPWVYEENTKFKRFLEKELRKGDIVITHHLPHYVSIDPKFSGADTNCFFLSDQSDLIEEQSPALWIHGHTHTSVDVTIGKTRIVANPFGYPSERTVYERKVVKV